MKLVSNNLCFPPPVKKSRHFCPVRKTPFNYWLSVVCKGVSRFRKLVRSCAQAYRTALSLIGPRKVQGILEQPRNHSEINGRRTLSILGHVTGLFFVDRQGCENFLRHYFLLKPWQQALILSFSWLARKSFGSKFPEASFDSWLVLIA